MNSYAATKPLTQLTDYFGGELVDITKAGTGFDYHERNLFNRMLIDKPENALIIWGLSFWHRFELGYRDIKDRRTVDYIQFNPSSIIQNSMARDFGFHHDELKLLPEQLFKHKTYVTDPYIEKHFRDLSYISGWLKNNNHEHIIFNFADGGYPKFLKQNPNYNALFEKNAGFVDLKNFQMNRWLFDNGVEPDPENLKIITRNVCHPVVDENLKKIMSTWIIDYYEENLK